ncbi:MAG: hypothetical protein AAF961_03070 [Planctomycetota bacterium]
MTLRPTIIQRKNLATVIGVAPANSSLPEASRVAALLTLLGIALVALLLIFSIMLAGSWVRRTGGYRRKTLNYRTDPLNRRKSTTRRPALGESLDGKGDAPPDDLRGAGEARDA